MYATEIFIIVYMWVKAKGSVNDLFHKADH